MEKNSKEKMAANIEMIDKLREDMQDHLELVPGVGQVTIKHKLTNQPSGYRYDDISLCNYRIIFKISLKYHYRSIGEPNKISTSTCMVCLTPPSTYSIQQYRFPLCNASNV